MQFGFLWFLVLHNVIYVRTYVLRKRHSSVNTSMEAELYDAISFALATDKSTVIELTSNIYLPIDRIIWSVWDTVSGPQRRFVWSIQQQAKETIRQEIFPESDADTKNSNNIVCNENDNEAEELVVDSGRHTFGLSKNRYATVYSLSSEIFR